MNILLFGATGMVGQGVLRECLAAPDVHLVRTIGRTALGIQHPKLREVLHPDLWHYEPLAAELTAFDACFFCLGVSSSTVSKLEYERITYGITLAAAEVLCRLNPQMTFIYVSGLGTQTSQEGGSHWARVKGRTENALRRLPFKAAYMFRPGLIQALHGIQSKTPSYRLIYLFAGPLFPLLRRLLPNHVLTTRQIGQAMLTAARAGAPKPVLEPPDIRALAGVL